MTIPEPKRILILSTGYYPNLVAGAEVAIKEITDRAGNGFVFDMITLRFDSNLPKFERVGNINVHRVGYAKPNPAPKELMSFPLYLNKVIFPFLAVLKFRSLDIKNRFDGIWAMMTYMGMAAVLIRWFARPVDYILTLQDGDDFRHILGRKRVRLFVPLIKKGFRDAKIIQTISNYLAAWAKEMGGTNVVVVPNGVEPSRFAPGPKVRGAERIVVTISRLVRKNGVDILIKAMKYLPSEVKLSIVGSGPDEGELKKLAAEHNLTDRVRFEGYVANDKILPYLSAADVFARPSRSEGQGISFLEAMAAKVPVVATAVGGIPDFLEDKETGLTCAEEDPEDLARKINIILRDDAIRANVVENAYKMVMERYDWQSIAKEIREKVFSNLD